MSNKLLSMNHLSEMIDVPKSTIYKWVSASKVPFIKLPNGRLKFRMSEIDKWLKDMELSTELASN